MKPKIDNIKMIFIDIDGTLYNSEKQVTEYTKNVLNKVKNKGIYVVLCSGRSSSSVCKVSKDVNASKYLIANNGAFVYNYIDDIDIFASEIEKSIWEKMWTLCERENLELIIEAKYQEYINEMIFRVESDKYIKIDKIDDIENKKIYQITFSKL